MDVLVTRPQPAADHLAARLTAAGHRALVLPVIETIGLAAECPPTRPDAVLFVSPAAVRHGWPLVESAAQHRAVLAVGRATARVLAERGVTAVVPDEERSEGLLALCRARGKDWRRVWIVRGRGGRQWLQTQLSRLGTRVDVLEVYERRRVTAPFATLAAPPDVVVVTSGEVFDAFDAAWRARSAELGGDPDAPVVIANVGRVAQMARASGYTNVLVADGAGDDAILAAVSQLPKPRIE